MKNSKNYNRNNTIFIHPCHSDEIMKVHTMGIVVSDVAMGQVFQQVFGLPLSMPFHLTCIYLSTTDPM